MLRSGGTPAAATARVRGMQRTRIPDELGDAFTVADARKAGVTDSRLRGGDLDAPYRGVRVIRGSTDPGKAEVPGATDRVRAGDTREKSSAAGAAGEAQGAADARELRRRALVFALTMPPNQFFTHVTAAVLWEVPVPAALLRDAFGRLRDLDVGVLAPLRHPRHAGVRGHQLKRGRAHVVTHEVHRVRLTTPASTWVALGSVIVDHYDLIAAADAIVRERIFTDDTPPLATLEQLHKALAAGRRVGGPALREALPRVRTRSASRMESRCRLILSDAGLPEPELNHVVLDDDGDFVACVDLAYPAVKIAIEYEGEHHLRNAEQWAKDIARYEALAAAGWFVIRVTKADVFDGRADLVRRVHHALRTRG